MEFGVFLGRGWCWGVRVWDYSGVWLCRVSRLGSGRHGVEVECDWLCCCILFLCCVWVSGAWLLVQICLRVCWRSPFI